MQQLTSASDSPFSPKPALHLHQVWKDLIQPASQKIAPRCSSTVKSPSPSPWISPTTCSWVLTLSWGGDCALHQHILPSSLPGAGIPGPSPKNEHFIAFALLTWCINYEHLQRIVLEIGSVLVQKPCLVNLQIRNAHQVFEERLAYF